MQPLLYILLPLRCESADGDKNTLLWIKPKDSKHLGRDDNWHHEGKMFKTTEASAEVNSAFTNSDNMSRSQLPIPEC